MRMDFDVIVAGGGGAAIRAAMEAADQGAQVGLICGGNIGAAGSTYYPLSPAWGIMYADSDADRAVFFDEIIASSMGCFRPELARRLVQDSADRYREMRKWGLSFTPLEDIQLKTCFGRVLRGAVLQDVAALQGCFETQLKKRNITVLPRLCAIDLIMMDSVCAGILCADEQGETHALSAGAVVLAMGGAESLWTYRCAGGTLLGGAYAMAARHGARVVNLEFIQFLLGTFSPVPHTLFYHFTMNTLPHLTNEDGETLLRDLPENVHPEDCLRAHAGHGPFTTLDCSMEIERAILRESAQRGRPSGAVLSYTQDIRSISSFSHWMGYLDRMEIDPMAQPFVLYPHCQGFNGGVLIDENAQTDLPGVYVCGESAGGIHGANRMGGNSILATQVFGCIAGRQAALHARVRKKVILSNRAWDGHTGEDRLTAQETIAQLRSVMQRYAFIERDATGLSKALRDIKELEKNFSPSVQATQNHSPAPYLISHALTSAELICFSMLQRKETRGGHFRVDCSSSDTQGALQPVFLSQI